MRLSSEGGKAVFEYGKCPMLDSDAVQRYGLSDNFVRKFCDKGCSVICGQLLKETLEKKGIKPKD